jgi:hypothetical protein
LHPNNGCNPSPPEKQFIRHGIIVMKETQHYCHYTWPAQAGQPVQVAEVQMLLI